MGVVEGVVGSDVTNGVAVWEPLVLMITLLHSASLVK